MVSPRSPSWDHVGARKRGWSLSDPDDCAIVRRVCNSDKGQQLYQQAQPARACRELHLFRPSDFLHRQLGQRSRRRAASLFGPLPPSRTAVGTLNPVGGSTLGSFMPP